MDFVQKKLQSALIIHISDPLTAKMTGFILRKSRLHCMSGCLHGTQNPDTGFSIHTSEVHPA